MQLKSDNPLVGTWIVDSEDSNVAFTFAVKKGRFSVSGFCRSDGEKFKISDVKWDGTALSFSARMPSTNTLSKNRFSIRKDGSADLELTIYEIWKKKAVKHKERPKGWDEK